MYKISQFSKLSGLSVKTLRYYDAQGMLLPSFRQEESQYRMYDEADLQRALLIKDLRALSFTIMEIKEILADSLQTDLSYILQEKIALIETNIAKEKALIKQLNDRVQGTAPVLPQTYQIDTIEVEDQLIAAIRFHGRYQELDHYVPLLYKAVKQNANGRHFNCYYDESYEDIAEIELCIPVKQPCADPSITCRSLSGFTALRMQHQGSYDTLYLAYKAMYDYANEHQITLLTPSIERYLKGPGMIFKGNPDRYVTELLFPFISKKE